MEPAVAAAAAAVDEKGECAASPYQVDPFLIEALQNPRHRLTVLRMELDVHKFLQNPDLHQFEFQHFPTSYLRCAAHRVAQYYGLQTLSLDNTGDGVSRILVTKTPEGKFRTPFLSDLPMKRLESEKTGLVKIAVRPRSSNTLPGSVFDPERKLSPPRTVEERKEEYDKARARIFSGSISSDAECDSSAIVGDLKNLCVLLDEPELPNALIDEIDNIGIKDCASRVAIFRDREKDRNDPDYDRRRYDRGLPVGQSFVLGACNPQSSPFVHYEGGFPHVPSVPNCFAYVQQPLPSSSVSPFCAFAASDRTAWDAAMFMQWPASALIYNQSYGHFRHGVFQAPLYQHPPSFEHLPNH